LPPSGYDFQFNILLLGKSMTKRNQQEHNAEIVSQFTKQAIPFTQLPGHLDSIQMLINMSGVGGNDTVLDVACGPGIVACEFARVARHVTGILILRRK
jgi:ubiquinone/menaquinone biosynthesis C-methylase UbiE